MMPKDDAGHANNDENVHGPAIAQTTSSQPVRGRI